MRFLRTTIGFALLALGACGNDKAGDNANAGAASESPYCETARQWAVHEFTQIDDNDAEQLRAYMKDHVAFIDEATAHAPREIAAQWKTTGSGFKALALPVFEKYDFSVERIMSEGTDAEKSVSEPPPDIAKAQGEILEYEGRVCDTSQPDAAEVSFAGPVDRDYCDARAALDGLIRDALVDPDPKAMQAVLTGTDLPKRMAAFENAAPSEIKQDVAALNRWDREKKIPLTASYGYDVRRLLLEGSASERRTLQDRLPEISDHYARVAAYDEQFCHADESESE